MDDDEGDGEMGFIPPKCLNSNDCAEHTGLFQTTSDQLSCGNGWRYGDASNTYCLLKCDNDKYCETKGAELGWPDGSTCKRNFCVLPDTDDPCKELKAEEFAPSNGTFRVNGDFIESKISKGDQVFVDGIFCSIKTEEEIEKEEETLRLKEEEERKKQEEERRKQEEKDRQKFEEEERKKFEEEERKKQEEEAKRKAEEERLRQEQLELIRIENEKMIKAEEERRKQEQERIEEERRQRELEEQRIRLEQEAQRQKEEDARKKAEEEARKKAEEEARKKAEEEARKKAEEEARKKAEEEARKKAEEEAKRKAEEEAKRKAEEEAKRKAEEEAKRKVEEEKLKREAEERERLNKERLKREAEEREKLLEESNKEKADNQKIVKDASTLALEKCIKEGFTDCKHKDVLYLINYYNENQINNIIIDKCKISSTEKNYIYDKIFLNDEEELDGIELSKKKYNLMRSKFNEKKIDCITNTLIEEIEAEKKLIEEREKLLEKKKIAAQPVSQAPSKVSDDEGSGFNDFIILALILSVVYIILKFKKLI
jgi:hypothetical protein